MKWKKKCGLRGFQCVLIIFLNLKIAPAKVKLIASGANLFLELGIECVTHVLIICYFRWKCRSEAKLI